MIISMGKQWSKTADYIIKKQKENEKLSMPKPNDLIVSINGVNAMPGVAGGSSRLMAQLEHVGDHWCRRSALQLANA